MHKRIAVVFLQIKVLEILRHGKMLGVHFKSSKMYNYDTVL